MNGGMGGTIKVFIGILIAVVLIGPVATTISSLISGTGAMSEGSSFASARAIIVLIPLGIVAGLVYWGYSTFSKRDGNGNM